MGHCVRELVWSKEYLTRIKPEPKKSLLEKEKSKRREEDREAKKKHGRKEEDRRKVSHPFNFYLIIVKLESSPHQRGLNLKPFPLERLEALRS